MVVINSLIANRRYLGGYAKGVFTLPIILTKKSAHRFPIVGNLTNIWFMRF